MKSALILISSFFLIGVFGESVSVMKENSVTLHTDRTEIQKDDSVEWKLNGVRIAKISMDSSGVISDWVSPDEAFGDRLQLDKRTGDLKITKFKATDSGEYLLKIRSTRGSSNKIFNVSDADKDQVKIVFGTVGGSVTLIPEKKSDELIQWRFGPKNTVIAELLANSSTVYPDERLRDRLKLDDDTGSLTVTNTSTRDSGEYEAGIRSRGSSYTIHKTFSVSVTGLSTAAPDSGRSTVVPDSGRSTGTKAWTVVGVLLLLVVVAAAAAGVIYPRYKSSKPARSSEENGQNHTSDKEEETELTKTDKT